MGAWIRTRPVSVSVKHPAGESFQVLYRRGGRGESVECAGSFGSAREANLRRDVVAGALAGGRDPRAVLEDPGPRRRSLAAWARDYEASRIDLAESSRRNLRSHLLRIVTPELASHDPCALTVAEVQAWVVSNLDLAPTSLARYLTSFRCLLDFAGADPNPARAKGLRLPRVEREEASPPSSEELASILENCHPRYRLLLVTLEQTGMRVGEACALRWSDVDELNCRFRLPAARTKTRRARWVQLPAWLVAALTSGCPPDDRVAERRVFSGLSAGGATQAMRRACRNACIALYSPHDLRHRRATIWHHEGLPTRVLMERGGWSRSQIAIDTYSHLLPLTELAQPELERLAA